MAAPIEAFADDCPLSPAQRRKLIELYTSHRAILPGASPRERLALLESISYAEFLRKYWDLDETTLTLFLARTLDLFALPANFVPASEAAGCALPGFRGLDLAADDDISNTEPYIHHFPDGNASIARLLVRKLCPHAAAARAWRTSSPRASTTVNWTGREPRCACGSRARWCRCATARMASICCT